MKVNVTQRKAFVSPRNRTDWFFLYFCCCELSSAWDTVRPAHSEGQTTAGKGRTDSPKAGEHETANRNEMV